MFIDCMLISLMSAFIGVTYVGILSKEEAFNFWWRFGARFEARWFYPPIWGCHLCFTGQFSLWCYLYCHLSLKIAPSASYIGIPALKMHFDNYTLVGHIFCVSAAIFIVAIFNNVLKILNNTLTKTDKWKDN